MPCNTDNVITEDGFNILNFQLEEAYCKICQGRVHIHDAVGCVSNGQKGMSCIRHVDQLTMKMMMNVFFVVMKTAKLMTYHVVQGVFVSIEIAEIMLFSFTAYILIFMIPADTALSVVELWKLMQS